MDPKEKELLDYLYTVGQNIKDYMRRNNYSFPDSYRVISIDVTLSPNEKYDHISAMASKGGPDKTESMVKKRDDVLKNRIEYQVVIGGSK